MSSLVTLITGASSGIGAAVARKLLARGHQVAVTGRRPDALEGLAEELGRPDALLTIAGDAGEPRDVHVAVSRVRERFGRLDVAIANAGYATHDDLENGNTESWRHMVLTNVLGPALLIHESLPLLKQSHGRIVLVGSVAGLVNTPGNIYGATKWAVTGMAENTRLQVAQYGIGVTLVSPGATATDFFSPVGGPPERPGGYMSADQLADTIVWAVHQPSNVDVSTLTVRTIGSPR